MPPSQPVAASTISAAPAAIASDAPIGPAEAEALVLFVAPELIRQAGTRCASALPPTALLRRTGGRYAIATQCIAGGQGVATLLEAVE